VENREGLLPVAPGNPAWAAYADSVTWTDGDSVSPADRSRVLDLLVRLMAERGHVVDVD
jgi:hypothetical protein